MKSKAVLIICASLIILIISPWIIAPVINNIRLSILQKELLSVQLPDNTEITETAGICGKLNGSGNGMDFLATAVIKTGLTEDEILDCIKGCKCQKQEGSYFENKLLEHGSIEYGTLKNVSDYSGYYVIYIYDGGHPALFDIRGN